MKVIPLETMSLTVPELVELVKEGEVILTRDGQPVVSVREVSESDRESESLAQHPQFMALVERSRRSYQQSGGVKMADLRRELGLDTDPSETG